MDVTADENPPPEKKIANTITFYFTVGLLMACPGSFFSPTNNQPAVYILASRDRTRHRPDLISRVLLCECCWPIAERQCVAITLPNCKKIYNSIDIIDFQSYSIFLLTHKRLFWYTFHCVDGTSKRVEIF